MSSPQTSSNPKIPRGSTREFIFFLQVAYLIALGIFVIAYRVDWINPRKDFFGPVPFLVPWFGAVGATLLSLSAVFEKHGDAWDAEFRFWHWARPLVGGIVATITVLILQSGILAVGGTTPNATTTNTVKNLLYYVFAFVVGYREDIFRQLIKRLADVILTPPETGSAAVPGAPTNVSGTPGDGVADISFTPPANDGGSPITGYTVVATDSTGVDVATATGTSSPIRVSGLTNGTPYTFTVSATNAAGTGTASAPTDAATPSPPAAPAAATAPGAPTNVTAVAGDGTADVSFDPPDSDGGAPITGYTVSSPEDPNVTASGETSPIRVNGLTNGTPYTFTVSATNAAGTGTASAPTDAATPSPPAAPAAATAPGAPTNVTAVAGDGTADVSFDPPDSDGGAPITGYTVSSPEDPNVTASGETSPIRVNGLTNGTPYTFTVSATNAAGTGTASAPTDAATPTA